MTENSAGRAAIFDLDGTLTDSKPGIVACLRETLLAYGVARTDGELESYIGPPMEMTMNALLNPLANTEGAKRAAAAAIRYRECYGATGWAENSVYAGIPELLERLKDAGVALYVCTSKRHDFAVRIVKKFDLAKYFVAVYGDPVDAALPGKAELLARVIQRERIAPEQAVMIGDRKFDIAAGKANGVKTIGVTFGYGSREELETAGADAVCDGPADLLTTVMMMSSQGEGEGMPTAVEFARGEQGRFLEELKALLRIPSISTDPAHVGDVRAAAEFVAAELKKIGLENVELIETAGHPLVYGDWLHAVDKPTVLFYGHYDVQPPEPLDEWLSPPFEPVERNGNLYARGAVDDKGQMYMHLKALESLMRTHGGKLPVNVRVLVEGEEEVGGEGIAAFLREHPERLKSDVALVSDTEMFAPELPTLCVGLRGMIYTEIEARGARTDLHSGMYGGAVPNPFIALAGVIAKLKDEDGRILIPGFYDRVKKVSEAEMKTWDLLPFDEAHYLGTEVGSKELTGEAGYSVLERTWARPTLDVHGMPGGFIGAGAKTVIPAKAVAKVSMRLVPDMTPAESFAQYKSYVESLCPKGIELEVRLIHSGDPIVIRVDNDYVAAAREALREVFGKETVFIRSGGSVPIVGDFERHLKIPTVMLGMGLPDDNLHAPNEKFHIANFYRGIEAVIGFLERL